MLHRAQDSRKEMSHLHALMLGPMVMATLSHGSWLGESHKDTDLTWLAAARQPQLDLQRATAGEFSDLRSLQCERICETSLRPDHLRHPRAGHGCQGAVPVSMSVPAGASASGTAAYVRHDKGLMHVSHIEDGGDALDAVFNMYVVHRGASACSVPNM